MTPVVWDATVFGPDNVLVQVECLRDGTGLDEAVLIETFSRRYGDGNDGDSGPVTWGKEPPWQTEVTSVIYSILGSISNIYDISDV
jgi:hypothetical protein